MDNSKLKYFIVGGAVLIVVFVAIYFLLFRSNSSSNSKYPKAVQQAINNPVSKNGEWSTLVNNDEYQISYSKESSNESFFVTVNAAPPITVGQKAEQALISKLGVSKDELCKLPVVINVTANADPNLTGYNFGLSFCSDRIHISDVSTKPMPSGEPTKDPGV